MGILFRF